MSQDAFRLYGAKTHAAEPQVSGIADEPDPAGLPELDSIDDNESDTLTGQSVLSSWLLTNPWARDHGEAVHLAANAMGTKTDTQPDYAAAARTIGSSLIAQITDGFAGLAELARGNGAERCLEGWQSHQR